MYKPKDERRIVTGFTREELGILCTCAVRYALCHDNRLTKKVPEIVAKKAEQMMPEHLAIIREDYKNRKPVGLGWHDMMDAIEGKL